MKSLRVANLAPLRAELSCHPHAALFQLRGRGREQEELEVQRLPDEETSCRGREPEGDALRSRAPLKCAKERKLLLTPLGIAGWHAVTFKFDFSEVEVKEGDRQTVVSPTMKEGSQILWCRLAFPLKVIPGSWSDER